MEFVFTPAPAALLFWIFTLLWLGELAAFPSPGTGAASRAGRHELVLLAAAIGGSLTATGILYHFDLGNLAGPAATVCRWTGIALYGGGAILRWWSARTLGRFFTRDVALADDHHLIGRGPYRLLRHPLYVGLYLLAVGMSLMMANPGGAALTAAAVLAALAPRVRREERLLEQRFGRSYRDWSARRYRLVPWLF